MKTPILIVLLTVSFGSVAQSHFIGFKFGPSWTNATGFAAATKNRQGFSGGITYEYVLGKHISLGADLMYNERGFIEEFQVHPQGYDLTAKMYLDYNYLSLPLKINYSIGNKVFGFGSVGINPAVQIQTAMYIPDIKYGNGNELTIDATDITQGSKKFDLGALCEVGGGYKIKKGPSLYTSLVYQQSVTAFSDQKPYTTGSPYHYGLIWSFGLKYQLKKAAS